jgi:hypothetical protein
MDYKKHYDALVTKGQNRELGLETYTEVHHIVPRSEGGTNEKSNLVKLTAREHFIAHWLLYRDNPSLKSRAFAFVAMSSKSKLGVKITSRIYEELKVAASKAHREKMTGTSRLESTKQKISEYRTGKKHSEESKKKMEHSHKGLKHSEESKIKMSEQNKKAYKNGARTPCVRDEIYRQKMSESLKQFWKQRKNLL